MSQKKLRPPYWASLRRLARRIPDRAALETALEGLSRTERAAMIARLRPHLTFELPVECPEQTE